MLAWINLLQDDGWVNDVLVWLGILDAPRNWLDGRASSGDPRARLRVRAVHDPAAVRVPRPDRPEPASKRRATSVQARSRRFAWSPCRSRCPAILAGIVIIALPMFGDYYTPDLLSGAPQTSLIGNQINLYIRGGQQIPVGAALVVVLDALPARPDGLLPRMRQRARRPEAGRA
mgnify:CR=1 FL=1